MILLDQMTLISATVLFGSILFGSKILLSKHLTQYALELAIILFIIYPIMAICISGTTRPYIMYSLINHDEKLKVLYYKTIPNQEIDVLVEDQKGRDIYVAFPWSENFEKKLAAAKMSSDATHQQIILAKNKGRNGSNEEDPYDAKTIEPDVKPDPFKE